jgi:hypothetical protein
LPTNSQNESLGKELPTESILYPTEGLQTASKIFYMKEINFAACMGDGRVQAFMSQLSNMGCVNGGEPKSAYTISGLTPKITCIYMGCRGN